MSTAETRQTRNYSDRHKYPPLTPVDDAAYVHWNLACLSRKATLDADRVGDIRGVARWQRLTQRQLRFASES